MYCEFKGCVKIVEINDKLERSMGYELLSWESSPIRSPLLLFGPRQVGKTTLLKDFALKIGKQTIEVNFWRDKSNQLKKIFTSNSDAFDILNELKDYFSVDKFNLNEDVLFIDEIQECPDAYSSLKSFKEQVPQLKVIATGSYLQLFINNNNLKRHPVGCVDFLYLRPLSFEEFLKNIDLYLYEKYRDLTISEFKITESLHLQLMRKLHEYFFTGGMPEIVYLFIHSQKNIKARLDIRKKQKNLIKQYIQDFQKYGKTLHVKKIDKLFLNIPTQLERVQEGSVSRFYYNDLGKNSNYNLFHWPFDYLVNAGLIIRSFLVSKNDIPFRVHEKNEERNIFKCFYFDIGLLQASLNISVQTLFDELGSYKGYIAENFIAQELYLKSNEELISYKKNSKNDSAEVEFLLKTDEGEVIPIEVKSSKKSLNAKSLESYIREYKPVKAYKLVPIRNHQGNGYISLPLYMVAKLY